MEQFLNIFEKCVGARAGTKNWHAVECAAHFEFCVRCACGSNIYTVPRTAVCSH